MKKVFVSLWALRAQFHNHLGGDTTNTSSLVKSGNQPRKRWKLSKVEHMEGIDSSRGDQSPVGQNTLVPRDDKRKSFSNSKFQRVLRNPMISGTFLVVSVKKNHHFDISFDFSHSWPEQCGTSVQDVRLIKSNWSTGLCVCVSHESHMDSFLVSYMEHWLIGLSWQVKFTHL